MNGNGDDAVPFLEESCRLHGHDGREVRGVEKRGDGEEVRDRDGGFLKRLAEHGRLVHAVHLKPVLAAVRDRDLAPVAEHVERDLALFAGGLDQRMSLANAERVADRIEEQVLNARGSRVCLGVNRAVESAVGEVVKEAVGDLPEGEERPGRCLEERLDDAAHHGADGIVDDADPEGARERGGIEACGTLEAAEVFEEHRHLRIELRRARGRHEVGRGAQKERVAEGFAELSERARGGRKAQSAFGRGVAERAGFEERDEEDEIRNGQRVELRIFGKRIGHVAQIACGKQEWLD